MTIDTCPRNDAVVDSLNAECRVVLCHDIPPFGLSHHADELIVTTLTVLVCTDYLALH